MPEGRAYIQPGYYASGNYALLVNSLDDCLTNPVFYYLHHNWRSATNALAALDLVTP